MNYGDVYPSPRHSSPLHQMCPPQVLISDHSTGIPLAIGSYRTGGSPYMPLLPGAIGATTIPCTTPASVLPPSPPPVLSTQLPHVFISDHSEVPAPMELRTLPALGTNIIPVPGESSDTRVGPTLVRRASEPAEALSSSLAQYRTETESKSKSRPTLQRYQSTTQTSNHWLKRVVVFVICALVVGSSIRIGVELWKDSYGKNESTTQIVQQN